MSRRSLTFCTMLALLLAPLVATDAVAGFWDRKPRTAEGHQHGTAPAKARATNAYAAAMHTMHKNMRTPLSGNPDADFVRQMIPHHQAALEMAKIQQRLGRNDRLKRFNDWVILAQTQEVAMMQNWLRRRDNGISHKDAKNYYGAAMKTMHHNMMQRYTGNADIDYARGMIAHHQGAVDMAEIWLREGSDPELKQLANAIYDSQTYEIAWLERWLEEHPRTKRREHERTAEERHP